MAQRDDNAGVLTAIVIFLPLSLGAFRVRMLCFSAAA